MVLCWCRPSQKEEEPDELVEDSDSFDDEDSEYKSRSAALPKVHAKEVEWLQQLIIAGWPRLEGFTRELVVTKLQPAIDAKLPKFLRGNFVIESVEFGDIVPTVGPIDVQKDEQDAIIIDYGINAKTQMSVSIRAASIPIVVKNMSLIGCLTAVLKPPLARPPFFGGLQLFFADSPKIDLELNGGAGLIDIKPIHKAVHNVIKKEICKRMVLPSCIALDLNEEDDVDAIDLKFPRPIGILRFTLESGSRLQAADWNLTTKASSDPYVNAEVGRASWKSPTVKATLDPSWTENNVVDFPVYADRQLLRISVFDEDVATADDEIGVAESIPIEDLIGEHQKHSVSLEPEGHLKFQTDWLSLSHGDPPKQCVGGPSQLFLTAKIVGITEFANNAAMPPLRVRLTVANQYEVTSPGSGGKLGKSHRIKRDMRKYIHNLAARGMPIQEIANVMELQPEQVQNVLLAESDPVAAEKLMHAAIKERAAKLPQFNQVLTMLLPWNTQVAASTAQLHLVDKTDHAVSASAVVPMQNFVASGGQLKGPFSLGAGTVLDAKLTVQWLLSS